MLTPVDEPIDRLEDLTQSEWDNLKDWESASEPLLGLLCLLRVGE